MKAMKHVLPLLLTLSLLLLPACGSQTAPAASPSSLPAPTASAAPAPAASQTPAATPGRLLDRTGQALDLTRYAGLSGAEDTFAHYLQSGNDVQLTIDLALQQQAQTLLAETLGDSGGAAVMVEVSTGAPLVIASHGQGGNRALLSTYQPRNLFLPCTAIASLGSNIITPEDQICCEGVFDRYEADGYAPACWIWTAGDLTHGNENMTTALRDSCDYYFYALGKDLGIYQLALYTESLGLGQPTGIELPENVGRVASLQTAKDNGREWRIGDTLEAAAGRNDNAFTPLQMAEYCAAIANKGLRYSASILGSVTDRDGNTRYTRQPQITGNIMSEKEQELAALLEKWNDLLEANWAAIHQGMYGAINDQSMNIHNAHIWQDCPWQVAGMANRIPVGNHAPYEDQVPCRGLFMGFAPYEVPQVAIFVVTEEAEGDASQQIARQLLDFYIEKST
ncbi:MAG: penicillin-binding transpeptidase domain-containing protein [Candidatus Limivicinus sp.]